MFSLKHGRLMGATIAIALAIPFSTALPANTCDSNSDGLCDASKECTTPSGQKGVCRQRVSSCHCKANNGLEVLFDDCSNPPAAPLGYKIYTGQEITFDLDGDCSVVQIDGDFPIGSFDLTLDSSVIILFTDAGDYQFSYLSAGGEGTGSITVSQASPVPAFPLPGKVALVSLLMLGGALYLKRRSRSIVTV